MFNFPKPTSCLLCSSDKTRLLISELGDLTCGSAEMIAQDESDVDRNGADRVAVCLDGVCKPLLSVTREIKDANPVVLDVRRKKNGRKEERREEDG